MSPTAETVEWTCARCDVTGSWMADVEHSGPPLHWAVDGDNVHCLACRRALAGEAAVEGGESEDTAETREKLRRNAIVEFELRRAPDRNNGAIARSCRTSPRVVANVRKQLS